MKKIVLSLILIQSVNATHPTLNNMSIHEKIGQLFMVGAFSYKKQPNQTINNIIKKHHIGGLIFMSGATSNQVKLTNHYQSITKYPLLFAQDNEWGRIKRQKDLEHFPSSMTIGAVTDHSIAYEVGKEFANRCKKLNIHLNLAPVVDINSNPENPVINDRSFGQDRDNVAAKGVLAMKGMQDHGVMACAKHFPGHGDTSIDSHLDLPIVSKSLEELYATELYPFIKMIENDTAAIMTSHILFPHLDDRPATVSYAILTNLLRNELGFNGIIITDSMNMNGISNLYPELYKAPLDAILAGADIVLFASSTEDPNLENTIANSINYIYQALLEGIITETRIDESVTRILEAKDKYLNIKNEKKSQFKKLKKKVYDQAVTLVHDHKSLLPIKKSPALVSIGNQKTYLSKKFDTSYFLPSDASNDQIKSLLDDLNNEEIVILNIHDMNRFSNDNWGIKQSTITLLKQLNNKHTIVIVFGSPYSIGLLENCTCLIVAYEDEKDSQKSVYKILTGKKNAQGRLPIQY